MRGLALVCGILLVLTRLVGPVAAGPYGPPTGTLSVSAQATGYEGVLNDLGANAFFNVYIVAEIDFADLGAAGQNSTNGILAWEGSLSARPELTVFAPTLGGPAPMNLAQPGETNFIVGLGGCVPVGGPVLLASFQVFCAGPVPQGTIASVTAAIPASIPDSAPAWVEAQPMNGCYPDGDPGSAVTCIFPFASMQALEHLPEAVQENDSWGGVKARFDRF